MKKPKVRKEPVKYNPRCLYWKTTQFGRFATFCRNKLYAKWRRRDALKLNQGEHHEQPTQEPTA